MYRTPVVDSESREITELIREAVNGEQVQDEDDDGLSD
jgi:hypothetical protein